MFVPVAGDAAVFDLSSSYTTVFQSSVTNSRLLIEDDLTTFNLSGGHTYTLDSTASTSLVVAASGLRIGGTVNGRLHLLGGTLSVANASIGGSTDARVTGSGAVNLDTSSVFVGSGILEIGDGLPGSFNYDGVVDTLDFNNLAANFGQELPGPEGVSSLDTIALVPEPSWGLGGVLIACMAKLLRRRHRRGANGRRGATRVPDT